MKPIACLGSWSSGHEQAGYAGSTLLNVADTGVFVNGKPAVCVDAQWGPHVHPQNGPHETSVAQGSVTVFIKGKSVVRVGDEMNCNPPGAKVISGCLNVFAGD